VAWSILAFYWNDPYINIYKFDMEINELIQCYFCFESFEIHVDPFPGKNSEIWDCTICCNPNLITYTIENDNILRLEVSSGNE